MFTSPCRSLQARTRCYWRRGTRNRWYPYFYSGKERAEFGQLLHLDVQRRCLLSSRPTGKEDVHKMLIIITLIQGRANFFTGGATKI